MAKHFIMGEGKLTDEERELLKKSRDEAEQKSKDYNALQQKLLKEEKQVTLEQLLKTTLTPMEDRIVVWRDKSQQFTEGGLIIPEEAQKRDRPSRGTVIAVGPGKIVDDIVINNYIQAKILKAMEVVHGQDLGFNTIRDDVKKMVAPSYKPGEHILFGRFAGTPVDDPETGEELLIMRPSDIFCKL